MSIKAGLICSWHLLMMLHKKHVFDNKVIIHPKYLSNFASSFFQLHKVWGVGEERVKIEEVNF